MPKFFWVDTLTILGLRIKGFDFPSLHYLLGETFVKGDYFFKTNLSKPLIIDCGANIGDSICFFKYHFPNSKIIAFEPFKKSYRLAKVNINKNKLKGVKLYNYLLGLNSESQKIFNDESSGSLLASILADRGGKHYSVVKKVRLSTFINSKVDMLKMDVEGAECDILDDLVSTKKINLINEMIIEFHHSLKGTKYGFEEFLLKLRKSGFSYQLDARCVPLYSKNKFQDILIFCYRK